MGFPSFNVDWQKVLAPLQALRLLLPAYFGGESVSADVEYASLSAAVTAIGATPTDLIISTPNFPDGANCTVPATLKIRFEGLGSLSIASGHTVTILSDSKHWPRRQIFTGTGALTLARHRYTPDIVGVKPDAESFPDAAITSGTNVLHIVSRAYTSADIGKKVLVYAAGPLSAHSGLNGVLRATVTGGSGSNFVLDKNAGATVSGASCVIGSENKTAMQRLMTGLPAGAAVELLPGAYMMGAVTLPSQLHLYAGPGAVALYSTETSMFTFHGTSGVTIEGITFDAGGAIYDGSGNVIGTGGHTILAGLSISDIRIERCRFVDSFLTNNVAPVDTYNRHAVLVRSVTRGWINRNYFENAMRIKAAGAGDTTDLEIAHNVMVRVNENGVSLLNADIDAKVYRVNIHDNIFDGIMESGNVVTLGDDGFILTVSGATNANPTVITTSAAHGLTTGKRIVLYGGTASWTPINGPFTVTVLSPTTFSIAVNSSGFGSLTGTVKVGATQEIVDVSVTNNLFFGPLPAGTNFIQNRGGYRQENISYEGNVFNNMSGVSEGTVTAIYQGNQTGSGNRVKNLIARGNKALGHFDSGAFKWSDVDGGIIGDNLVDPNGLVIDYGHRVFFSNDLLVRHNKVRNTTVGMQFRDVTDSTVKSNEVKDTSQEGIGIETDDVSAESSILFKNNVIKRAGTFAFEATPVGTHTDQYVDNDFEDNTSGNYNGIPDAEIIGTVREDADGIDIPASKTYHVGGNPVLGERRGGWVEPTGTIARGSFDPSTVTLEQLGQRVAALLKDLGASAGVAGPIHATSLNSGLTAGWNFTELSGALVTDDVLGVENLTNHSTVAHASGAFGDLAAFDGTNYLSHSDDATLSLGEIDFTLAVPASIVGTGTTQSFVTKDDGSGNREFWFGYNGGVGVYEFNCWEADTTIRRLRASTFGTPADNALHLVIVRYNAATDTLYIRVDDGPDDTLATSGTLVEGTAEFQIGHAAYGSDILRADGKIGRVFLWKRLLTDAECLEIWNGGAYVKYPF